MSSGDLMTNGCSGNGDGPITEPDYFRVEIDRAHPTVIRVSLVGEFDLAAVPYAEHKIIGTIRVADKSVVMNLGRLTFCDSSCIHMFLRAQREADARDIALVFRDPVPTVRRVLEMTLGGGALSIEP